MDIQHFHQTLSEAFKKRNFAMLMAGILALSNVLLSCRLLMRDTHMILCPWPTNQNETLSLSTTDFSDEYLQSFADRFTSRLLTMNPYTVDQRMMEFMAFTEQSEYLLKKLQKEGEKVREERVSTVFYPRAFSIDRKNKTISVKGDFHTYFGTDKAPVVSSKKVTLTWSRAQQGIFLIQDFEIEDNHDF